MNSGMEQCSYFLITCSLKLEMPGDFPNCLRHISLRVGGAERRAQVGVSGLSLEVGRGLRVQRLREDMVLM